MFTIIQALSFLAVLSGSASAGVVLQKRDNICNAKGDDRGQGNYSFDDSGKYSTYAACSALCTADTECKSFGFGGKDCMLFNIALTGNFDGDSSSSDTYYDRGCISSASTSSSSSTTSAGTTTTSKGTTTSTTATTSTSKTTTATTTKATTTSQTTTTSKKQRTTTTPKNDAQSTGTSDSTSKTSSKSSSATTLSSKTSSSSSSTKIATTSGTATTASSAPSVTIPADCASKVPATLSMSSFRWFNSAHNLDCVSGNANFASDAQVCWNSTGLCNSGDAGCTCTPYCYTGLPSYAYQPLGYGPPDTISIGFEGDSIVCAAANPQSIRRNEIGQGHFDCGSAADYIGFSGDSNNDTGNTGFVYYNAYGKTCNGRVPRYEGRFPLTCSHDAGNNATCTAPTSVALSLVSF